MSLSTSQRTTNTDKDCHDSQITTIEFMNQNAQPQEVDESQILPYYENFQIEIDATQVSKETQKPQDYEYEEDPYFYDIQLEKMQAQEAYRMKLQDQEMGKSDFYVTPGLTFDDSFESDNMMDKSRITFNHSKQIQFKQQELSYGYATYQGPPDLQIFDPQYFLNQSTQFTDENLKKDLFQIIDPFEQLQPQQILHEQQQLEQLINLQNQTVQEYDNEDIINQMKEKYGQWSDQRKLPEKVKRRGAPFKGAVSNNKEEKFKVERQSYIRKYKAFYEQRLYLETKIEKSKKKKVYKDPKELEEAQLQISENDAHTLFGRHYNKIQGDFSIIRDPMYKYSKQVKERMFKDNIMAFLWMYYRLTYNEQGYQQEQEQEIEIDPIIKDMIYMDFDSLAMETLKQGHYSYCCFIFQLIREAEQRFHQNNQN